MVPTSTQIKSQTRFFIIQITTIAIVAFLLSCCGCVNVPYTRLKGTVMGEPYSINSPKDSELSGLTVEASVDMGGVKHVTIKVDKLTAHMNPDVISQTAIGQAAIIRATSDAVNQGIQNGVAIATKAAGKP